MDFWSNIRLEDKIIRAYGTMGIRAEIERSADGSNVHYLIST